MHVIEIASAADLDVFRRLDKHVACGDDIDDGRLAWVGEGEPDGYGDVVAGAAEGDGEEAVEAEQQLGAAVVVRCVGRVRVSTLGEGMTDCICQSWVGWTGSVREPCRHRNRAGNCLDRRICFE